LSRLSSDITGNEFLIVLLFRLITKNPEDFRWAPV
ncbi:MAG: hypothetical protein ACI8P9_005801, partial [Parasphingorhabdus sp.]